MSRPSAECVCCHRFVPIMARHLCDRCYSRIRRRRSTTGDATELHTYPTQRTPSTHYTPLHPSPRPNGEAHKNALRYQALTSPPTSLSRNVACRVLGITVRTAYRYEAWLRSQPTSQANIDIPISTPDKDTTP